MDTDGIRFLTLICGCIVVAAGSQIDFISTPDTVTLGLTTSLTLRCSLSDTVDQSNPSIPVIGRRRREAKGEGISSRALSPTFNTEHVISIIVTEIGEKNKTVASIAIGAGPVGYIDMENLQVQGHVLSQPGERAYLELTWSQPDLDLQGIYECRISATDPIGFPISYVQELTVEINEPNISQLVHRLWELEEGLRKNNKRMENLETVTESRLSALEAEVNNTKQEIPSLRPHTEQGRVYCGHINSWSPAGHSFSYSETGHWDYPSQTARESIHQVVFQRPYDSEPAILISANMLNTRTPVSRAGTWVGAVCEVSVTNVTTHGFVLKCSAGYNDGVTSSEDGENVSGLNVDWISSVKE